MSIIGTVKAIIFSNKKSVSLEAAENGNFYDIPYNEEISWGDRRVYAASLPKGTRLTARDDGTLAVYEGVNPRIAWPMRSITAGWLEWRRNKVLAYDFTGGPSFFEKVRDKLGFGKERN